MIPHRGMDTVGRGLRRWEGDPNFLLKIAEQSEMSGRVPSYNLPGYRGVYGKTTKSASEASVLNEMLSCLDEASKAHDTRTGRSCRNPAGSFEHTKLYKTVHSLLIPEYPGVKADYLKTQGFSIGTREPVKCRRHQRLSYRSQGMVFDRGRASVVVRGWESHPHGEGKQITRRIFAWRNCLWT
jgi:hypothetical protein